MGYEACPSCKNVMKWQSGLYFCDSCNQNYEKINECLDCENPLEILRACGASNLFCHQCNSLKSRHNAKTYWQAVTNLS